MSNKNDQDIREIAFSVQCNLYRITMRDGAIEEVPGTMRSWQMPWEHHEKVAQSIAAERIGRYVVFKYIPPGLDTYINSFE